MRKTIETCDARPYVLKLSFHTLCVDYSTWGARRGSMGLAFCMSAFEVHYISALGGLFVSVGYEQGWPFHFVLMAIHHAGGSKVLGMLA